MLEQSMAIIPSIWASLTSWFTPTILFLFLNLTIATIAITSTLHKQPPQQNQNAQPQELARSPSMLHRLKSINFYTYNNNNKPQDPQEEEPQQILSRSPSVLHRLKSINLYNHFSPQETISTTTPPIHITQETVTHFPPKQEDPKEVEEEEEELEENEEVEDLQERSFEEIYSELKGNYNKQVIKSKSDTKPTSGEMPTKLYKKMKKSTSAKLAFSHLEENDIGESRRPATAREGHNGKLASEVGDAEVDAKADDFINRFKQQLKLQRVDSTLR